MAEMQHINSAGYVFHLYTTGCINYKLEYIFYIYYEDNTWQSMHASLPRKNLNSFSCFNIGYVAAGAI